MEQNKTLKVLTDYFEYNNGILLLIPFFVSLLFTIFIRFLNFSNIWTSFSFVWVFIFGFSIIFNIILARFLSQQKDNYFIILLYPLVIFYTFNICCFILEPIPSIFFVFLFIIYFKRNIVPISILYYYYFHIQNPFGNFLLNIFLIIFFTLIGIFCVVTTMDTLSRPMVGFN